MFQSFLSLYLSPFISDRFGESLAGIHQSYVTAASNNNLFLVAVVVVGRDTFSVVPLLCIYLRLVIDKGLSGMHKSHVAAALAIFLLSPAWLSPEGRDTSLPILTECNRFGESLAGTHQSYVTAASTNEFVSRRSCRRLARHVFSRSFVLYLSPFSD